MMTDLERNDPLQSNRQPGESVPEVCSDDKPNCPPDPQEDEYQGDQSQFPVDGRYQRWIWSFGVEAVSPEFLLGDSFNVRDSMLLVALMQAFD